jgi:DNA polymerase III delta prime subunit
MDWLNATLLVLTLGVMAFYLTRRTLRRVVQHPVAPTSSRRPVVRRSVPAELVHQGWLVARLMRQRLGAVRGRTLLPPPSGLAPDVVSPPLVDDAVVPYDRWWSLLLRSTHTIISGPKGAGKTTVARALASDLAHQGAKLVLVDPHHKQGDWGESIRPWCAGRRLEEARAVFGWAIGEIDRRFKARADDGTDVFDELVIVVDELDLFTSKRPDVPDDLRTLAGQFVAMLGDETRKVGVRLIVIAHGTEVENLGLAGIGSKRRNYAMLRLSDGEHGPDAHGTLTVGTRTVTVDTRPLAARCDETLLLADLVPRETVLPSTQPLAPPETAVSPVGNTHCENDDLFPGVDFAAFARLVEAGIIGETKLLEVALLVRPGSSRAYAVARSKLKAALVHTDIVD